MHVRYSRRYPVRCPITFKGTQLVGEGAVINISLGGWKVESDQAVKPGSSFSLQIALPDQHAPMKVDVATVRWVDGREFGLQAVELRPAEQRRLSTFVSSLEEKSAS